MPAARPLARALSLTIACAATFGASAPGIASHTAQRALRARVGALPTAKEVVARYDRALGGIEAIHRHTSATLTGTLELRKPDGFAKIPLVVRMRAPYFQLTTGTLPNNAGEDSSGFDGANAWHLAPGAKPEVFTGNTRESIKRDADFYYAITELSWFKSIETVGIEEFEGHSCYHLHGTTNWGVSNNQFYDRATGLLVGYEFDNVWRGAPALEHMIFSHYEKIDGVLVSMTQTSKAQLKSGGDWAVAQIMTNTSVTFNNVDPSVFTPPQAVRDLLAKK
jgi:hypothetical protein